VVLKHGSSLSNRKAPRGTLGLTIWSYKIYMEAAGFDPRTSPPVSALTYFCQPLFLSLILERYTDLFIFKLNIWYWWRGVGPGLSPGPRFLHTPYDLCQRRCGKGVVVLTHGFITRHI
jgi:hypothetical protein